MEDIKRLILPAMTAIVLHGLLISSNMPKLEMSRPAHKDDSITIEINTYFPKTNAPQKNEEKKEEIESTTISQMTPAETENITQPVINQNKQKKVLIKPKQTDEKNDTNESSEHSDLKKEHVTNNNISDSQLSASDKPKNSNVNIIQSVTDSDKFKNQSGRKIESVKKSLGTMPKKAFPNYLKNKQPQYPVMARRRGYEGETLLNVLVDTKGLVSEIKIKHSSGHQSLDRAALQAIKNWIFTPATDGLRPVAMWVDVPVRFQLK